MECKGIATYKFKGAGGTLHLWMPHHRFITFKMPWQAFKLMMCMFLKSLKLLDHTVAKMNLTVMGFCEVIVADKWLVVLGSSIMDDVSVVHFAVFL